MQDGFAGALICLLKIEGGLADWPNDPGGLTNRGITLTTLSAFLGRPVERVELITLSQEVTAQIYRERYWNAVRGDDLPTGLDGVVFDAAVNSGPRQAILWLQRALGVKDDGVIGPKTLAAIEVADTAQLISAFCDLRLAFLQRLPHWNDFGKGWERRVDRVRAAGWAAVA